MDKSRVIKENAHLSAMKYSDLPGSIIKPYTLKEFKAGVVPYEHEEQSAFVEWRKKAYPSIRGFAVPNGEYRPKRTAVKLQEEGVEAGVPDYITPLARGPYHGLYIEFKRAKGAKVSDVQKEWIDYLRAQGYCAVVAFGCEEGIRLFGKYLSLGPYVGGKRTEL